VDGFDLDLIDGALGSLLGEARDGQREDHSQSDC
jgi:hypothetical protein